MWAPVRVGRRESLEGSEQLGDPMGAVRRVADLPVVWPVGVTSRRDADQTEAGEGVGTWLDEGSVLMVL